MFVFFDSSVLSSRVTTKSLIVVPKYSSFSEVHALGFQV